MGASGYRVEAEATLPVAAARRRARVLQSSGSSASSRGRAGGPRRRHRPAARRPARRWLPARCPRASCHWGGPEKTTSKRAPTPRSSQANTSAWATVAWSPRRVLARLASMTSTTPVLLDQHRLGGAPAGRLDTRRRRCRRTGRATRQSRMPGEDVEQRASLAPVADGPGALRRGSQQFMPQADRRRRMPASLSDPAPRRTGLPSPRHPRRHAGPRTAIPGGPGPRRSQRQREGHAGPQTAGGSGGPGGGGRRQGVAERRGGRAPAAARPPSRGPRTSTPAGCRRAVT